MNADGRWALTPLGSAAALSSVTTSLVSAYLALSGLSTRVVCPGFGSCAPFYNGVSVFLLVASIALAVASASYLVRLRSAFRLMAILAFVVIDILGLGMYVTGPAASLAAMSLAAVSVALSVGAWKASKRSTPD